MSEKIRKFLEADVEKVAGTNDQLWFSASTEHRDRHGDVVVADGWKTKDYMKNPVFLWAHDYSKPPIGKSVQIEKGDGKLRNKVQFVPAHIDPFAEQVKQLYQEGFMRTVSVGFMTYKREKLTEEDLKQRPELQYGERLHGDLLEVSAVPVPANPMALQNGFLEAVAKGMSRTGQEPKKGEGLQDFLKLLLPDSEEADARLRNIRALVALSMGARGGLSLSAEQVLSLRREAFELGDKSLEVLEPQALQNPEMLRELFADVWDEEVLDLLQKAQEIAPVEKTEGGLTEEENAAVKAVLASTAQTLAAVNAVLK
ncbi:HK97 family phage prohead protease [Candidatus Parcubacteria bacterium]|nr:HK97 family phage prohead protease [Candidatus Parcubacteria bacterium]